MKLSILIPTLPEPESKAFVKRLSNILDPQLEKTEGVVEVITHDGDRSMPTGTKRNRLIELARGEYIVQIDCDDIIPVYYVAELLKAIEQNPDVITFKGFMTTNGTERKNFTIKLGSDYTERDGHYYRFPNHLCCYKKSLVENIKFPPIWIQEDYQWALAVKNSRVLKSEIHIDHWMYHYDFKTKPSTIQQKMRR